MGCLLFSCFSPSKSKAPLAAAQNINSNNQSNNSLETDSPSTSQNDLSSNPDSLTELMDSALSPLTSGKYQGRLSSYEVYEDGDDLDFSYDDIIID